VRALAHESSTVTHHCDRAQCSGLRSPDSTIAGLCSYYSRRHDGEELAEAVAWSRRLVADLSAQRIAFDPRAIHVGIVTDKSNSGTGSSPLSPVSVFPLVFCIQLSITDTACIILAVNSI
jgi:hypothetical protein